MCQISFEGTYHRLLSTCHWFWGDFEPEYRNAFSLCLWTSLLEMIAFDFAAKILAVVMGENLTNPIMVFRSLYLFHSRQSQSTLCFRVPFLIQLNQHRYISQWRSSVSERELQWSTLWIWAHLKPMIWYWHIPWMIQQQLTCFYWPISGGDPALGSCFFWLRCKSQQ